MKSIDIDINIIDINIKENPFLQVAPFNKAIESQRRYEALRKISQKNFQLETVEMNKQIIESINYQTNSKSNENKNRIKSKKYSCNQSGQG